MYRDYYLFVLSRDILLYRPVIRSSLTSIAQYPTVYSDVDDGNVDSRATDPRRVCALRSDSQSDGGLPVSILASLPMVS